MARRRAFSLVELLVVLGVIAVLIGLILPALGRVRERAREAQSMANLVGVARVLGLYGGGSDDAYPFGEVGRSYDVSVARGGIGRSFASPFDFGYAWPVLVREVAPWDEASNGWFSPPTVDFSQTGDLTALFSYPLSHTVFARPALWRVGAAADPTLLRGARHSDVAFPASKAVSWDDHQRYLVDRIESGVYPGRLGNPRPVLFADGHGEVLSVDVCTRPVLNVMNPDPGTRDAPLHNTPLGVLGRDWQP